MAAEWVLQEERALIEEGKKGKKGTVPKNCHACIDMMPITAKPLRKKPSSEVMQL